MCPARCAGILDRRKILTGSGCVLPKQKKLSWKTGFPHPVRVWTSQATKGLPPATGSPELPQTPGCPGSAGSQTPNTSPAFWSEPERN